MGGVLTTSPFTAIQRLASSDAEGPGLLELMLGPYDQDTDHPFHRLERGESTMEEYGSWLLTELAARQVSMSAVGGGMEAMVSVIDASVAAVRAVRAHGLKTAMLTNNVAHERDKWRAMLPLTEIFDVVVDSSEVGMRKPNPRIYHHTLDLLGVTAARTVFLDDAPGNIAGARAVGMTAILVAEPVSDAFTELSKLLGVLL
jgi:epoxide hydrolase-like predicted phosphatase